MLRKGDKISDYTLIRRLGQGGFGQVWQAEKRTELSTNEFAIKFFVPKDESKIDRDKIRKEIETWKKVSGYSHIISVIEADIFEEYVYVVSELAEGGALDKYIIRHEGQAKNQAEAVKITTDILIGLEQMHGEGFVHRDLKPANILIKKGLYCLADFGISREMKTNSKATGTSGTYEYMPPEAFDAKPSVTVHTDIWAVGVILQKLLTGKLPYPQEEIPSLMGAILMGEPEKMSDNVPLEFRQIVEKALQKKREDRFQTATQMHAEIEKAWKKVQRLRETIDEESFDQNIIEIQKAEAEKERLARELAEAKRQSEKLQRELEAERQKQAKIEADEVVRLERERIERETAAEKERQRLAEEQKAKESQRLADEQKAKQQRREAAEADSVKNSIGMEFVKIPAGSFMMGSPPSEKDRRDDETQHRVTISKDFYLGKYEVTQGQWKAVMGNNPSSFSNCGENCPVENVSWEEVQEFIKKLNGKGEGRYRLPTEAEWEYGCRGGKEGEVFGVGDGKNLSSNEANFAGNYPYGNASKGKYLQKTVAVGSYQANGYGLYDMHGNVWEWCNDWYGAYPSGSVTDPTGPGTGSGRVLRGGSWGNYGRYLRSASRSYYSPSNRNYLLGFRLVRE